MKISSFRVIRVVLLPVSLTIFLTSCDDLLNVLVIPEGDEGNYYFGKVSYSDWTGRGGLLFLFDREGNVKKCEGKYSMIKNSLSCQGKKFFGELIHSGKETADFNFTMISCRESYGIAVDDLGKKYQIYIGISDELIKYKLAGYKGEGIF